MKTTRIILLAAALLSVFVFTAAAESSAAVLATNSWTAAFVEMAGGEAVRLAPSDMEHPPEYELRPSDVLSVRDADFIVFAGYEVLMKTVFESFGKNDDRLIRIKTSYSPAVVEKSVAAIAERLGTADAARENIDSYNRSLESARKALRNAGIFGSTVLVQFHQKAAAEALGFEIAGVFGPMPLEVRQIAALSKTKPDFIIDNVHSPMAAPLAEILGVDVVGLANFPSAEDEQSDKPALIAVLEGNAAALLK